MDRCHGLEPYPSEDMGEICHIQVDYGTVSIGSHSKMVLFQMVIEKNLLMCRAGEELKRGNGPWRFRISGFQENWGSL